MSNLVGKQPVAAKKVYSKGGFQYDNTKTDLSK
jgi:hypothetical protein